MSGSKRGLAVFIDALGPRQLERFPAPPSWLPHRAALQSTLGFSSGALATWLTGVAPDVHGRMCLFAAAPPGARLQGAWPTGR